MLLEALKSHIVNLFFMYSFGAIKIRLRFFDSIKTCLNVFISLYFSGKPGNVKDFRKNLLEKELQNAW